MEFYLKIARLYIMDRATSGRADEKDGWGGERVAVPIPREALLFRKRFVPARTCAHG
jgi:hypothetical protein